MFGSLQSPSRHPPVTFLSPARLQAEFTWAVQLVRSRAFTGPYEGRGPQDLPDLPRPRQSLNRTLVASVPGPCSAVGFHQRSASWMKPGNVPILVNFGPRGQNQIKLDDLDDSPFELQYFAPKMKRDVIPEAGAERGWRFCVIGEWPQRCIGSCIGHSFDRPTAEIGELVHLWFSPVVHLFHAFFIIFHHFLMTYMTL